MAYAKVDSENRIIEWSYEHLNGFDVEFSNGDYVDEVCVDGVEDFIIENGKAIFSPKAEKEIMSLKKKLSETDYTTSKLMEAMVDCESISDIVKVFKAYKNKYGDVTVNRQKWRDRINELEQTIK